MKLRISSFADAGQADKERLIIKAESDTDIGDYLVMASSISSSGGATAGRKTAYWFPDKDVKAGDLVVLYSKSGTQSEKKLQSGATAHFFYWGLETPPQWSAGKGAVLLFADEWKFEIPSKK
jgi:hypothetical protein